MVIVDTSVWVDFFNARESPVVARLELLLEEEIDLFTTGVIAQELLHGVKNKRARHQLISELERFILIMPTLDTHIRAAEIYDACRKKGITIRGIIDCLIAALALEYGLSLLAKDRDYAKIAQVFPLKMESV